MIEQAKWEAVEKAGRALLQEMDERLSHNVLQGERRNLAHAFEELEQSR